MQPALFLSHGPPSLLLEDTPARTFLERLGPQLGRPRAVLCVSAHWTTRTPAADSSARPSTIHDFSGFSPELHATQYPAPGTPELAREAASAITAAGMQCTLVERGLDHGAWVPLMALFPAADVPVFQVAVQPALGARHHWQLGRALAPLREQQVLVLGSGNATHNLHEIAPDTEAPSWVREFDDWLVRTLDNSDIDALLDYRRRAPAAERNHPTEEHFLPLVVAMAAAGDGAVARTLHRSYQWHSLSMAAFAFGGDEPRS
jgi:4,5-DOPA dioxygenase extradiol